MAVVQRCIFLLVFAIFEGQISVSCNTELWSLSSDKLSGYIRPKCFQVLKRLLFYLGIQETFSLGLLCMYTVPKNKQSRNFKFLLKA